MMRSRLRALILCVAGVVLASCAGPDDLGKQEAYLAVPGPWDIPEETAAIGDTQYVSYTGAGPWTGPEACSGNITPGAQEIRTWLLAAFPQISSIGGYSCRAIVGDSSTMSVHGTGRALDIMIPLDTGEADNGLGDPVGNYLIEHAEEMGIQLIIWDLWVWNASRSAGTKERSYGGTHPHHDHLHVEVSVEAANKATPWFDGPRELPGPDDCPDLGPDGGVLEETGPCFNAYGPAMYWRTVTDTGHDGSLLWTNAFQSTTASNWARWHVRPVQAAEYTVEVYTQEPWAIFESTRYAIRHAGVTDEVVLDQRAASGWRTLGTFTFDTEPGQHVTVYDAHDGAVASEQHIAVDALRVTRVGTSPDGPAAVGPSADPAPVRLTAPVPWIEGGDPSVDDDPALDPDGRPVMRIQSGCSVHASPGAGAPLGLAPLAVALLALRRRRR